MHPAMMGKARATKPKKCAMCGKQYTPRPGAQPFETWCSITCGVELGRERAEKALLKRQAKELRERKVALTPRSKVLQQAEQAVRAYCRERDRFEPCMSCGRTVAEVETQGYKPGGYWDGGHYLSKGSHPELRLCTWNIWKQCKTCNGGAGNYVKKHSTVQRAYRERLVAKIGEERVQWLEGPHKPLQPDIVYLRRVRAIFTRRTRQLAKRHGRA
jgi:5-methylcytosine-specific restriction endonuclease McrA